MVTFGTEEKNECIRHASAYSRSDDLYCQFQNLMTCALLFADCVIEMNAKVQT